MPIQIKELARVVLPCGKTEGWLLLLRAYLDDSGTHANAPAVVIGGLLGKTENWEMLEQEWRAKLAAPLPDKPPLKAFHLSHLLGTYGEFKHYTPAERDWLRRDFREIILGAGLYQLSCVVSRADWDELVISPYRENMGSAEQACFTGFIQRSLNMIRKLNVPNLKIAYIYDQGRKTPKFDNLMQIAEDEKYRPEIASVTWGRVDDMPPLQAADMIANESYRAAQDWLVDGTLKNASLHFKQLTGNMAHDGLILDREAIQDEINRRGPDGKLLL